MSSFEGELGSSKKLILKSRTDECEEEGQQRDEEEGQQRGEEEGQQRDEEEGQQRGEEEVPELSNLEIQEEEDERKSEVQW